MPHRLLLPLIAAALLGACTFRDTDTVSRGQEIYSNHCIGCHGALGTGTPEARGPYKEVPNSLIGLAARNGGTFPAVQVMNKIWRDDGDLHQVAMPDFADVFVNDPLVPFDAGDGIAEPTPQSLIVLIEYLKTLQV